MVNNFVRRVTNSYKRKEHTRHRGQDESRHFPLLAKEVFVVLQERARFELALPNLHTYYKSRDADMMLLNVFVSKGDMTLPLES